MQKKLSEIADIQLGFPFRGKIENLAAGDIHVLQPRDISGIGDIKWDSEGIGKVSLPGRATPMYLEASDILMPAKGRDNTPKVIPEDINDRLVVASPHFYSIRVTPRYEKDLLPAYVAWWLRQKPIQDYYAKYAVGSAVKNLTRAVIEETPIVIPSDKEMVNTFMAVIFLDAHTQKLNQLIENNNKLQAGLAQNILSKHKDSTELDIADPSAIEELHKYMKAMKSNSDDNPDLAKAAFISLTDTKPNSDKE
jgi:hypothetical protein